MHICSDSGRKIIDVRAEWTSQVRFQHFDIRRPRYPTLYATSFLSGRLSFFFLLVPTGVDDGSSYLTSFPESAMVLGSGAPGTLSSLLTSPPSPQANHSPGSNHTNNGLGGLLGLSPDASTEYPRPAPANAGMRPADVDGDEQLEARPPYLHAMIAGGLGGTSGDMLMHSLDTVKTRQQGDPHMPPRYTSLGGSYYKIIRQEGVRRGLYGGWLPALLGSFPGTVIFFGTYEWSKRHMVDAGMQPHLAYLAAGRLPVFGRFQGYGKGG